MGTSRKPNCQLSTVHQKGMLAFWKRRQQMRLLSLYGLDLAPIKPKRHMYEQCSAAAQCETQRCLLRQYTTHPKKLLWCCFCCKVPRWRFALWRCSQASIVPRCTCWIDDAIFGKYGYLKKDFHLVASKRALICLVLCYDMVRVTE